MKQVMRLAALGAAALEAMEIAMEEDVQDGKTFHEHEHEFYVEIDDLEQLKGAQSVDLQEQWNLKVDKTEGNAAKGALRIRQIYKGDLNGGPNQKPQGEAQYVLTTKVNQGVGKRLEVPVPTTVDAFNLFAMLSDSGMIKHRYHFPVGELVFEVDMFLNPEGGYYPVAKIDLEVKNMDGKIPELPIKVKSCIMGDTKDAAEKKKISEYYDKYFISKNKMKDEAESIAQEGFTIEQKLQRLRDRRQGTVAQEGIMDFLLRRKKKEKKAVTPGKPQTLWDWRQANFKNNRLNPSLVLTGKSITIDGRISSMGYLDDKKIESVGEVLKAFDATLKFYSDTFDKYKQPLADVCKTLDELVTETDHYHGQRADEVKWEDVRSVLMKYKGKLPASFANSFSVPRTPLLGAFATGFIDKEKSLPGGKGFPFEVNLEQKGSVTFPAIDKAELGKLVKGVSDTFALMRRMEDFWSGHGAMGIDQSDPPWRWFEELDQDREALAVLDDYSSEPFELMYTNIYEVIQQRLDYTAEFLVALIRAAVSAPRGDGDHEYR